jgi:rSAM/selenodomain-associated transferase 1
VAAARRASGASAVAIVILAKHPVPGRVKTRLAATIGAERACALYVGFVRDLAHRLQSWSGPVWWAITPGSSPFARLAGTRRCFAQRGRDLGARIDHALRAVHRRTGGPVIALGADVPHVARRELRRAARALAGGIDVVLGPAEDGGYYLIGVRVPHAGLFADIAWGTGTVAAATRRRCRGLRLSVVELARDFDVDDVEDVARLARWVRRRPREFPYTRPALEPLNRRGGALRLVASPSSDCARR